MNNLVKYIALEKLLQTISHGRVNLELSLRSGEIVGITTTGTKKTLYNSSAIDQNNNQVALEYLVRRISQQLENQNLWEITFKVNGNSDKIKTIEVTSTQTQR